MKKEDFAAMLNNREYREEMSRADGDYAKSLGLVVVFGASDDLMEFRGAIHDEWGCYDGGSVQIDKEGIIPSWDDVKDDEREAEAYFNRKRHGRVINAIWGKGDMSWQYETAIPHACFDILEDGETYCRGIVFSLEDL